jgi:hypothetical protein
MRLSQNIGKVKDKDLIPRAKTKELNGESSFQNPSVQDSGSRFA